MGSVEGRRHWAFELLEAHRLGDVQRLKTALERRQVDINTVTTHGGYGGFRFVCWRNTMSGETLLHLACRNHNYPRSFEIVETLIAAGIDVSLRNDIHKTARDLNPKLFDAAYPISQWSSCAALAWAQSASSKIQNQTSWLKVLGSSQIDGTTLTQIWSAKEFRHWVKEHLPDLTRFGVPAASLDDEIVQWLFEFDRLRTQTQLAAKLRRRYLRIQRRATRAVSPNSDSPLRLPQVDRDDTVAKS